MTHPLQTTATNFARERFYDVTTIASISCGIAKFVYAIVYSSCRASSVRRTAIGRVTVASLAMNDAAVIEILEDLLEEGLFPRRARASMMSRRAGALWLGLFF